MLGQAPLTFKGAGTSVQICACVCAWMQAPHCRGACEICYGNIMYDVVAYECVRVRLSYTFKLTEKQITLRGVWYKM